MTTLRTIAELDAEGDAIKAEAFRLAAPKRGESYRFTAPVVNVNERITLTGLGWLVATERAR